MEIKIILSCDNWLVAEEMILKVVPLSIQLKEIRPDVAVNVEAEIKQF